MLVGRIFLVSLFALTLALPAQGKESARAAKPLLKSIYSGVHTLAEFQDKDTRAVVAVFLDTECPVARRYAPRLAELHERFRNKGVRMIGVYPNPRVDVFSMATHAHDVDIPFPVYLDLEQALTDRLDAEVTPEAIVLDAKLEKCYQGPIDNQFTKRGSLPEATEHYLADAIVAVLEDKPVRVPRVTASGCPIGRQENLTIDRKLTFHKDVAPILAKNCQACHRKGGVGPFELATYQDAYYNAERIAEAVGERRMPPWHGVLNPDFGELDNAIRLTDDEVSTVLSWVSQGTAEGDKKDAPPPIRWPPADAWTIPKPDFVYKMEKPFSVPKHGVLEYQFFRVPLNQATDRWYRAVEVKPGNAEVVHHIAIHLVPASNKTYSGATAMAELYGFNSQRANVICDYVPGDTYNAKTYPADQAVRIPKNSDVIFEVHYTPNDREATTDQSQIGFVWANKPPREEVLSQVFRKPVGRFRIPPHHPHYRVEDSYYFESDVDIDAIRPHFHLRGKSYRLELVDRDEESGEIRRRKTVLTVPIYDANWQRTYELKTPLRILAGTELLATAHYDNSRINPNNPDPSAEVHWGQRITDEMFSTRFKYRVVKEPRIETAEKPAP
ncbi:MAG: redoxin domain-containing protein [Pirellulales bacterium]